MNESRMDNVHGDENFVECLCKNEPCTCSDEPSSHWDDDYDNVFGIETNNQE